jgi:hypothetical protein
VLSWGRSIIHGCDRGIGHSGSPCGAAGTGGRRIRNREARAVVTWDRLPFSFLEIP